MNTPWNFNYVKLFTPEKFNIRPSYDISNLYIDNNSNIIRGFSLSQIQLLTVGMKISLPNNIIFGSNRTIISIEILTRSLVYSGDALVTGVNSETFYFTSFPGYFSQQPSPLTGQQLHDNFFYVSEGLTNHQERLLTIESYNKTVGDAKIGYVAYNGLVNKEANFYGGNPLILIPQSHFDTERVYDNASTYTFSIAIGSGIKNIITDSTFYEITLGNGLAVNTKFPVLQDFCNYANLKLVNNNRPEGYAFRSNVDMSTINISGDYATLNWDSEIDASFYIAIDDADDTNVIKVKLEESDRPLNLSTLINTLNNKFIALNISTRVYAESINIGGGDTRLYIKGINTRTGINPGCTRVKIFNIPTGTFIEDVLKMEESSIYDFSTTLRFEVNPNNVNKINIVGLDPSFRISLKDGTFFAALNSIGFGPSQFTGTFISYHTTVPSNTNNTLNFDGVFRATKGIFNNVDFINLAGTNIISTSITNSGSITSNSILSDTIETTGLSDLHSVIVQNNLDVLGVTTVNEFNASGITTLSSDVFVTNTLHDDPLTLYKLPLLESVSPFNLISANAPVSATNNYLLVNGNFGAFNLDVVGSLRIHQNSITPLPGRLYAGDALPTNNIYKLNFDGIFRATTLTQTSSRAAKTNINPSTINALEILMNTLVVDYNFKSDPTTPKIGFIAEDTHPLLSTPEQNSVDITNCIGTIIKSIQELYTIIKE